MPAGFHEVRLPPTISSGAQGGPGFHTTIMTLASGFERRNIDWTKTRAQYNIAPGVKTPTDMQALIKFFYARQGKAFGFRYKDWSDYRLPFWKTTPGDIDTIPTMMTTDGGVTTTFQITKLYGDTGGSFRRTLNKIVTGTLQLRDNGVPTSDASVDYNTGIVTLGATLGATTGHILQLYCEFDVPVRFDIDDLNITAHFEHLQEWTNVPLVEVRV